jgi:hypothetical protein
VSRAIWFSHTLLVLTLYDVSVADSSRLRSRKCRIQNLDPHSIGTQQSHDKQGPYADDAALFTTASQARHAPPLAQYASPYKTLASLRLRMRFNF